MHYWTADGRQVLDGVAGPVVRQRRPLPAAHRRGDPASRRPSWTSRRRSRWATRRPSSWPTRLVDIAPRASDKVVLHQLRLRGRRHRAEDGAGLSPRARRRRAHPADRPRARLSRRRLRRHLGRRHRRPTARCSAPLLAGVDHLRHTHDPARNAYSRGLPAHGAELADDLERLVALHDASTIAAVIVEPVAGSTGVLLPPQGYLQRLREICDRHGILLIFDEVITGFGRLGAPFAAQTVRRHARPDDLRQGPHQRRGADGRGARARRRSTTPS